MNYELDHIDVREAITKLCEGFPNKYWQKCSQNINHTMIDS